MSKSDDVLTVVGSWSAIGTLALGVLAFIRGTSYTSVELRQEVRHQWAEPFALGKHSLEQDIRTAVARIKEDNEPPYGEDFFITLVVRVNRGGAKPLNVEYVELFDTHRKQTILRANGASGETVRTIEAHDHYEWKFYLDEAWKYLAVHYRDDNFPRVKVRVMKGNGKPLRWRRKSIKGERLLALYRTSQKVLGELRTRR